MVFSSAISLFFFVPIVFLLDRRLSNVDAKNTWLLLASLVFYSFGQVYYLPLLLLSVALNYVCGRLAAGKYAKLGVTLAVIGGIGLLAVFKYADFAIRTVNALCGLHLPLTGIALPIGISFFTFQGLSYVIDVYREPKMVSHSFKKVLLYIAFFPQLIAGPIVKYHDVEQEIDSRRTTPQETALGIRRFICGLSKKLLLSNALGQMADTVFALPAGEIGMLAGWTGAICYTLQIYFDFSGYSDMAIGLGRMFGFHFRENFNYPYTATTIKEFWRRWHISLSGWFRDYLYIPLGGNRKGKARTWLNRFLVFFATGLWHGASWNFVLWGLYFFVLLSIEKQIAPKLETLPFIVRNLVTMFFVLIGWVLFMNTSLSGIGSAFAAMFGGGTSFAGSGVSLQLKNSLPLLLTCLIGSSVLPRWFGFIWSGLFGMGRSDRRGAVTVKKGIYLASVFLFLILLLWLCTVSLVGSTSSPSMYAQF